MWIFFKHVHVCYTSVTSEDVILLPEFRCEIYNNWLHRVIVPMWLRKRRKLYIYIYIVLCSPLHRYLDAISWLRVKTAPRGSQQQRWRSTEARCLRVLSRKKERDNREKEGKSALYHSREKRPALSLSGVNKRTRHSPVTGSRRAVSYSLFIVST